MTRHRGPKTDRWLWMSCDSAAVSTVEQNYAANPSNGAKEKRKRKKKPWLIFRLDILNNCSSDIFPHTCVLTCGACAQENATWDLELCFPKYTHTLTHTVACSHRCPHFLPPCCSLYLLPVWVVLPARLAALRIQVVSFMVSVFQNWYHTLHINQIRRRHFVYITFLSSSSYLRCVYTICNQTSLLWLFF